MFHLYVLTKQILQIAKCTSTVLPADVDIIIIIIINTCKINLNSKRFLYETFSSQDMK